MKFITVRDLKQKTADIWKLVQKDQEFVITSNGRPIAFLTRISEDTFEEDIDIHRRVKALKALDRIHKESVKKGTETLSSKTIEREVKKVRKSRIDS